LNEGYKLNAREDEDFEFIRNSAEFEKIIK
jgi:hypothetical protein